MKTDRINYLNIGLMIVSAIAAYRFPFELFLFSYAVLGPLHYLTEISWLHEKNYFTDNGKSKRKQGPNRRWLMLVAFAMVFLMFGFFATEFLNWRISSTWEVTFLYLVLITALLITELKNSTAAIAFFLVAAVSLFFFSGSKYYFVGGLFLLTIVHVFIFTGAFILHGALRSKSASGILSLVVFVLCAVGLLVLSPETGQAASDYVRNSYNSFNALNAELIKMFNLGAGDTLTEVYESSVGLMIMRLIAFAYTYHYLNWFSKTSIIKWHEVPKSRIAIIAAIWVASLAIYLYNYDTGMTVLYFLSVLHVMLEFPLNHRTFAGIGRELYAMAR